MAERHSRRLLLVLAISLATFSDFRRHSLRAAEPDARVTIDVAATGKPVPPTLHGMFFEDINYAADGGLYAELVQNRSFEHRGPLYGWRELAADTAEGNLAVADETPLNDNNPHYLQIHVVDPGTTGYGLANLGFDGIAVTSGEKYRVSFYARQAGDSPVEVLVQLQDADGTPLAEHRFAQVAADWQPFEAELTSSQTTTTARLAVLVTAAGDVDVDMVSLFPVDTFRGRRNGLRRDLAQVLADARPGFFRFPGGCIVEGMDLENAYRWKDTIGDVAERKQNYNLWRNDESPQYCQTYGLGFFEYFQLSEDIGAEPVPVVNCGMCCQARRRGAHAALDELGPWIADALDLVEFANGPITSEWGAKRAAMGHPDPFDMKYLAVGNEQWNEEYFARYEPFYNAIKARYPEIHIISTSGPNVSSGLYDFAWNKFRTGTPAEVVDEHYYVQPEWLLQNTDFYSKYDRNGPKIFVGEYAAHDGRGRRNNLRAALAEAAYMTGLVRHSDVVLMASYAPLFGKFGHSQWQPNLIWFDNTRVVRTPSYHAQAIFARNRADVVLPIEIETAETTTRSGGMVGVGTWNTRAEYKDIQVTAPNGEVLYQSDFAAGMDEWQTARGAWEVGDGALRQDRIETDVRAVVGDPSWTDYTLTLKARKLGGQEGFLILFHSPNLDDPTWWNIGGWNNTSHAIQESQFPETHVEGSIENDRWYDIRVELAGGSVKAYLDDKLIHAAEAATAYQLYAAAGVDEAAGELVVELVNPTDRPCDTKMELTGFGSATTDATAVTLTAESPQSENSLEQPERVAPQTSTITGVAAEFRHRVPPHAIQVLRIPVSR